MAKSTIKIAVVSDVVCPWCYIGKRRLERAMATVADQFDFEIAYYPYELNPDTPRAGVGNKEYLTNKFGGEDEYQRLTNHVSTIAATEGLNFNFEKQRVHPNTRDAHRLILFARESGKDVALVEALFKAYFEDGVDLSKIESLCNLAMSVGLDEQEVRTFLSSDTGTSEVIVAEQELQKMGIRGVPFYIVDDQYGISGAQATETFIEAFNNIGKEMLAAADSCDVNEKNC